MKTKTLIKSYSFGAIVCPGAFLLLAGSASAQTLFVADWYSPGNIYELNSSGTPSTFYSGFTSNLGEPEGLAFDGSGNLFVADSLNGNIDEITPGGTFSTFASGLGDVNSLAFNGAGNLFAADYANGDIYEFTPQGAQSVFASGLSLPGGLAFNTAGDLFASDNSGNIYEYTSQGSRSIFASGLNNPYALAFDGVGNLFVGYGGSGAGNGGIAKISTGGQITPFATDQYGPNFLAFDSAGNLYLANDGSGDVDKFTPNGTESTFATGLGNATGLAIQGQTLPVPEPSTLALITAGVGAWLIRRRKK
jgi:PEP-CTERM motif-containing protein